MRLLLDTHAFLWFVLDDQRLSDKALALISDTENVVEISSASLWEIAIKNSLGKYSLNQPFGNFVESQIAMNSLRVLHIDPKHAEVVCTLPFHHRDPFDRMIAAQAISENFPVVSVDSAFDLYGVARVW